MSLKEVQWVGIKRKVQGIQESCCAKRTRAPLMFADVIRFAPVLVNEDALFAASAPNVYMSATFMYVSEAIQKICFMARWRRTNR